MVNGREKSDACAFEGPLEGHFVNRRERGELRDHGMCSELTAD